MDVLGGHLISYWIWNTFCVWIVYVFLFFAKVQATSFWESSHNHHNGLLLLTSKQEDQAMLHVNIT
jgi:hypothetical protein